MTNPVPEFEALVEVGAKVLYDLDPLMDQPVDLDGRPLMPAAAIPWDAVDECEPDLSSMHRRDARAILAAVLPLVAGPAVGALDRFVPTEGYNPDCGCTECTEIQQARTTRDQLARLIQTKEGG